MRPPDDDERLVINVVRASSEATLLFTRWKVSTHNARQPLVLGAWFYRQGYFRVAALALAALTSTLQLDDGEGYDKRRLTAWR